MGFKWRPGLGTWEAYGDYDTMAIDLVSIHLE
jgi:hypothetical protein